jgi:tRNA threonylcarbamoyladenosine biosynthesis protein TsaB
MKLLALDTSGELCSVALFVDGVIEQRREPAPRRHGELLLPMMESLLESTGIALSALDAIAFGRGPGSFTGVRIAVAVAQGAAFGAGCPTVPVSTLAAMALGEYRRTGRRRILTALDARMGELYWGAFEVAEDESVVAIGAERVVLPECVPVPTGTGWCGVGSGWGAYRAALEQRVGTGLTAVAADGVCEAMDIARIAAGEARAGRVVAAELARPVYLRDRVTATPGQTHPGAVLPPAPGGHPGMDHGV